MPSRNDPFEMIERMFEQMRRQYDDVRRSGRSTEGGIGQPASGAMGIDLADHGDEFVVTADVPGYQTEDIDLRLAGNTLSIDATEERSSEEETETYLRSERQHRSLSERIQFPEPVDEEAVEAALKNGVLTVHLPKADPAGAGGREIDIE